MPAPINHLKAALVAGQPQYGIWLNLASATSAEVLAGAGFDWLLIDGEHGPNLIPQMLAQAQAIGSRTQVVVRPPVGEAWMIKQILDLGVQTILVPMVESAAHAEQMVKAMRYPPEGIRGMGSAVARSGDFGRNRDYAATANAQVCLVLQVESRAGLAALPAILQLAGVDGVFIGPADLAADMGFGGDASAPEVQAAIDMALRAIVASGKAAGILTFDAATAKRYAAMGVQFLGIGGDVGLLVTAASKLLADVR